MKRLMCMMALILTACAAPPPEPTATPIPDTPTPAVYDVVLEIRTDILVPLDLYKIKYGKNSEMERESFYELPEGTGYRAVWSKSYTGETGDIFILSITSRNSGDCAIVVDGKDEVIQILNLSFGDAEETITCQYEIP